MRKLEEQGILEIARWEEGHIRSMNYETTCLMTRRFQPAVNFPRGVEALNPLHSPCTIVIPLVTALIPVSSFAATPHRLSPHVPPPFPNPRSPGRRGAPHPQDTGTHFSVIRYSFLIFYGSLVYFPVSSFPIVRPASPTRRTSFARHDPPATSEPRFSS